MKLRRRITKRGCIALVLFLTAGAIVNVAVAWACVCLDVADGDWLMGRVDERDGAWLVSIQQRTGAMLLQSTSETKDNAGLESDFDDSPSGRTDPAIVNAIAREFFLRVPAWSKVHGDWPGPHTTTQKLSDFEFEDARGWPTLSFRSGFDLDGYEFKHELAKRRGTPLTDEEIRSPELISAIGIALPSGDCTQSGILLRSPNAASGSRDFRILPLRPIWPGFAINTVFYAFVLWLLFAAPFALRRRLRVKRGLCVKCAYDLRGRAPMSDVCPECGAASLHPS